MVSGRERGLWEGANKGPSGWISNLCQIFSQTTTLFQKASGDIGGYESIKLR